MKLPPIEHALVTDTDHMPGRGGYALVSASPGVTQAERRFVADNLGVSDYLHAPANKRMYFSFFRVPDARYAFVRRFASGTRRNGVQNRLFVHTLFLEDEALQALYGWPWLLADMSVRPERSTEAIPMGRVINREQSDPEMPRLEWERIRPDQAHHYFRRRIEAFSALMPSGRSGANLTAEEYIARAATALARSSRLFLPQGPAFELLTLLTWSILPIPDRVAQSWTQHDHARIAGIEFQLRNVPGETDSDLAAGSTAVARRALNINTESVTAWLEFAETTKERGVAWGDGDIHAWLEYRERLNALLSDPAASDDTLLTRLTGLAQSVRPDEKGWWLNARTILGFVWARIIFLTEQDTPHGEAIERTSDLAKRSGIGRVIFREPPSSEWLDAGASQIEPDLLIHFFLVVTENTAEAWKAREAIAAWALDRIERGTRLSSDTLARLAIAMAPDRAALLVPLLETILRRGDGFRALNSALPAKPDYRLSDVILLAILAGLRKGDRDTGFFAKEAYLRQLEDTPSLANELNGTTAIAIAESLRGDRSAFAKFALFLPDPTLASVALAVDSWIAQDAKAWMPLGRALLQRAQSQNRAGVELTRLAFTAAARDESHEIWLPIMIRVAKRLDGSAQSETKAVFAEKVETLVVRFAGHSGATTHVLEAVREHASTSAVGSCLRALLMASRAGWSHARQAAAKTVHAVVASVYNRPAEWETSVLALLDPREIAESERATLSAFWQRLGARDVESVSIAAIRALYALRGHADEVVKTWTPRLRSLRLGSQSRALIAALRVIASPLLRPDLELEIGLWELAGGVDTAATYSNIDLALRGSDPKSRVKRFTEIIDRKIGSHTPAVRAAWLMGLFVSRSTLMPTRSVIEEQLLPNALRKLTAAEWLEVIELGKESLFIFDYFLVTVCRRAVALRAHEAVQLLFEESKARGRSAATDALLVALKGKLPTASIEEVR